MDGGRTGTSSTRAEAEQFEHAFLIDYTAICMFAVAIVGRQQMAICLVRSKEASEPEHFDLKGAEPFIGSCGMQKT